jgi:hypothetical protein
VTSASDLPFHGSLAYHENRWWLPVSILPAFGLTLWALWRRRRTVVTLGVITGVGFLLGIFAMASLRGATWSYLTWWTWVLGALSGVLTLAGLWALLAPRWERIARPLLLAVTLVVGVAVAVVLIRDAADARVPSDTTGLTTAQQQSLARDIGTSVTRAMESQGQGPVVLDLTHGWFETPALALALERAGIPVRIVGRDAAVPYGSERRWICGRARARLSVFSDDDVIRYYKPKGRVIARWAVPYSADERHRQLLTRTAYLAQPPSTPRTNMLDRLDSQLNGPKYLVEVFDQGRVEAAC